VWQNWHCNVTRFVAGAVAVVAVVVSAIVSSSTVWAQLANFAPLMRGPHNAIFTALVEGR
jgi:hypothetical protein